MAKTTSKKAKRRFKDIVTILLKGQGIKPKTPRLTPKGYDYMMQGYQPSNEGLGKSNPPKGGSGVVRHCHCPILGRCIILKGA